MRRFLFLLALFGAGALHAETAAERARYLVDKSNELLRGNSSHAVIAMTIETPTWKRRLVVESWNQGRTKALMRIHEPLKESGNGTLKIKSELWNWLPAVERVMKIPPSMMQSSWMGSDFTYNDVVKSDSVVQDYTHKILSEEKQTDGSTLYTIEALPKPDAAVVWGRVLIQVSESPEGVLPVEEKDFSERGELMRVIAFSQVKRLGGRLIPTQLECRPQRKPQNRTLIQYQVFEVGVEFSPTHFSLQNLQKPLRPLPKN